MWNSFCRKKKYFLNESLFFLHSYPLDHYSSWNRCLRKVSDNEQIEKISEKREAWMWQNKQFNIITPSYKLFYWEWQIAVSAISQHFPKWKSWGIWNCSNRKSRDIELHPKCPTLKTLRKSSHWHDSVLKRSCCLPGLCWRSLYPQKGITGQIASLFFWKLLERPVDYKVATK